MKKMALALAMGVGLAPAAYAEGAPYGAVMGSYVLPEENRDAGFGLGGQIVFLGVPVAKYLNVELGGFANTLHRSSDNGNDGQYGLGVDLNIPLAHDTISPFLLVGGGAVYDDLKALSGNRRVVPYFNYGGGIRVQFTSRLAARFEVRSLIDYNEDTVAAGKSANDYRLNLGVQYSFTAPPPPPPPAAEPPPPAPAAVAPPPPPPDSDGDGVIDSKDECPNTPKGVKVDAKGCPLDTDGDGVPDYLDKCPGTPKGFKVDANGCIVEQKIVMRAVTFEYNKDVLTAEAKASLDEAAAALLAQPKLSVEVSGHTDSKGADAYNRTLSKKRAESVKKYLVSKGVSADALSAVGYGKTQPIASNATEEGRAENRRVEFKVLVKPEGVKVVNEAPKVTHPEAKAKKAKAPKSAAKPAAKPAEAPAAPAAAPAPAPAPAAKP